MNSPPPPGIQRRPAVTNFPERHLATTKTARCRHRMPAAISNATPLAAGPGSKQHKYHLRVVSEGRHTPEVRRSGQRREPGVRSAVRTGRVRCPHPVGRAQRTASSAESASRSVEDIAAHQTSRHRLLSIGGGRCRPGYPGDQAFLFVVAERVDRCAGAFGHLAR